MVVDLGSAKSSRKAKEATRKAEGGNILGMTGKSYMKTTYRHDFAEEKL
jgi:hypothetical protein